ncbi:hypothetical protein BGZ50_006373, partial [Haplosporangium sp. Z 11]
MVDVKKHAKMADGVGLFMDSQIYIAGAALTHKPKAKKRFEDLYKFKASTRDAWISQIKSTCRDDGLPRKGFSVFGSTSLRDHTRFYKMDVTSVFRVYEVNIMTIPLNQTDFGNGMKA